MNNKQTSVDWQFDQLSTENLLGLFTYDQMKRAMEILEQAKAMHKDESISFAENFAKQMLENKRFVNAEIIYNETYGGNK